MQINNQMVQSTSNSFHINQISTVIQEASSNNCTFSLKKVNCLFILNQFIQTHIKLVELLVYKIQLYDC